MPLCCSGCPALPGAGHSPCGTTHGTGGTVCFVFFFVCAPCMHVAWRRLRITYTLAQAQPSCAHPCVSPTTQSNPSRVSGFESECPSLLPPCRPIGTGTAHSQHRSESILPAGGGGACRRSPRACLFDSAHATTARRNPTASAARSPPTTAHFATPPSPNYYPRRTHARAARVFVCVTGP